MRCCTKAALIRPGGHLLPEGRRPASLYRRRPSPFRERVPVGRVRACFIAMTMASISYACPLCKDALSTGLARGFYWSILLMLSVPVLVVGVISTVVWRAYRRKSAGLMDG